MGQNLKKKIKIDASWSNLRKNNQILFYMSDLQEVLVGALVMGHKPMDKLWQIGNAFIDHTVYYNVAK